VHGWPNSHDVYFFVGGWAIRRFRLTIASSDAATSMNSSTFGGLGVAARPTSPYGASLPRAITPLRARCARTRFHRASPLCRQHRHCAFGDMRRRQHRAWSSKSPTCGLSKVTSGSSSTQRGRSLLPAQRIPDISPDRPSCLQFIRPSCATGSCVFIPPLLSHWRSIACTSRIRGTKPTIGSRWSRTC